MRILEAVGPAAAQDVFDAGLVLERRGVPYAITTGLGFVLSVNEPDEDQARQALREEPRFRQWLTRKSNDSPMR